MAGRRADELYLECVVRDHHQKPRLRILTENVKVTLPPPKCLLAPYIWKPLTGGYYRGFSQLESIEPSRFSLYTHFTASHSSQYFVGTPFASITAWHLLHHELYKPIIKSVGTASHASHIILLNCDSGIFEAS
jgi:hypothetical protein